MPILDLQRQLRTLGRIRMGNQVPFGRDGKRRANKLETWRLTSPSYVMIAAAAEAYGGDVVPWANPGGGAEFEVITRSDTLDIAVPPGHSVSQWYELWSAGGCQRRCNGVTNVLDESPCACPSDVQTRLALAAKGEACKATTRLTVLLPALPDLGAWVLESHGYYAAVELAGAAEILAIASAAGQLIPARLRLEQRTKRIPGQPTRQYAVPVIELLETRMDELGVGGSPRPQGQLSGGHPARPQLPATTLPPTSDFRGPTQRGIEAEPDGQPGPSVGASDSRSEDAGHGASVVEPAPARSLSCGHVAGPGVVEGAICGRQAGHPGAHKTADQSASWPQVTAA